MEGPIKHTDHLDKHLQNEEISMVVDAMFFGSYDKLPKNMVMHIENCEKCKMDILSVYELNHEFIKKNNKKNDPESIQQPPTRLEYPQKKSRLFLLLRIAALIILMIGLFLTGREVINPVKNRLAEAQKSINMNDPDIRDIYMDYSLFENMIESDFRSIINIKVLYPELSSAFFTRQTIKFKWEINVTDTLNLKITNNKGKELFNYKDLKRNKLRFNKNLNPGRYYWKLETTEELIYVGRFYVFKRI